MGRDGHPPDRRDLLDQGRLDPVSAHGIGGRAANSTDCSQNLDSLLRRVDLRRRHQGLRRGPLHAQLLQRVRHLRPRHEARRSSRDVHAGTVTPTRTSDAPSGHASTSTAIRYQDARTQRDNIAWQAPKEKYTLAGRVERALGRHPQGPAAQRGQAGRLFEPGRHDGPGGRPHGPDHHLGRDAQVELPVLPEHRHA